MNIQMKSKKITSRTMVLSTFPFLAAFALITMFSNKSFAQSLQEEEAAVNQMDLELQQFGLDLIQDRIAQEELDRQENTLAQSSQ